jgi:hypothetical protein
LNCIVLEYSESFQNSELQVIAEQLADLAEGKAISISVSLCVTILDVQRSKSVAEQLFNVSH